MFLCETLNAASGLFCLIFQLMNNVEACFSFKSQVSFSTLKKKNQLQHEFGSLGFVLLVFLFCFLIKIWLQRYMGHFDQHFGSTHQGFETIMAGMPRQLVNLFFY